MSRWELFRANRDGEVLASRGAFVAWNGAIVAILSVGVFLLLQPLLYTAKTEDQHGLALTLVCTALALQLAHSIYAWTSIARRDTLYRGQRFPQVDRRTLRDDRHAAERGRTR